MFAQIRRLGAVAAFIACALLLAGCGNSNTHFAAAARSSAPKMTVVAIGDSIMRGNGLSPAQAWPALVAASNNWSLTNLACDGAGFVALGVANQCGSDFSGLVAKAASLHPALILISGSSNDLGVDDGLLGAQTDAVVTALRSAIPTATIVGISTVWNDTDAPHQIADINTQVRDAVKQAGGVYLDIGQPLTGHADWLQSDDVHPTAEGQEVLAMAIDGAIRGANLTLGG
ncbi:MAG: SGNH/GDSL hydrolase family protein [Terrimesophilobacter sp.]